MATRGNSKPERIAVWKVLHTGVRPLLAEMPYLTELHTELGGVIVRSEELDVRHEALKAETREVNRIREELARSGEELRNRIGAALQTMHGFRSERLIEFGLKPRRARGRDRQTRTRRPRTAAPQQDQTAADPQGQPQTQT
jgi:hypothetical protein